MSTEIARRAKVLLVDADALTRDARTSALRASGLDVATAVAGLVALDVLDRECPDVVVSSARIGDMDGYELLARMRREPAGMDTPFLLLAGRDRATALAASEAGADLVVTGDVAPDALVGHVMSLLGHGGGQRPMRRIERPAGKRALEPLWEAFDSASSRPPSLGPGSFGGSLDVMDLAEVTQAIALGAKSGTLLVALSAGDGTMLFDGGRLRHAAFAGRTGEVAFAALIHASQRDAHASFRFQPLDREEVAASPRTIARSVEQLLLSIAAGIDEGPTCPAAAQSVS